jgi:hypothetical protein
MKSVLNTLATALPYQTLVGTEVQTSKKILNMEY